MKKGRTRIRPTQSFYGQKYEGRGCTTCGNTIRYVSTGTCTQCLYDRQQGERKPWGRLTIRTVRLGESY